MDRITTVADNGENVIVLSNSTPGVWSIAMRNYSKYTIYGFVADRLAAYEDTGLSPEEIVALKEEKEKCDKLLKESEALLWDSRFNHCPKCGGKHISVVRKQIKVKSERTYYSYYFAFCHSCKYKGGLARLPSGVLDAWNKETIGERNGNTAQDTLLPTS